MKILAAVLLSAFFYQQLVQTSESVAPSELEPAFRDNFYDVTIGRESAWIVGYYGTILRSRDRGLTWELQHSKTTEALFRVRFIDDKAGWISGSYGTILHTRDGGASWQLQQTPVQEHLFGLHFIDVRRGWAVGSRGTVLATEDGGTTWHDRSVGDDVILNDVHFTDAEQGWAVGEFGRIYRSRDGGRRWERETSPIEVPPVSGESRNLFRLFVDGRSSWAFGLDGVILTNRNGQWQVVDHRSPTADPASRYHLFAAAAVGGGKWAVGERGTILMLPENAGRWSRADFQTPPVTLNGIAFGTDGLGLIVGNRGVILRSADEGEQWRQLKITRERSPLAGEKPGLG